MFTIKLFCIAKLKSENEYFRAEIKDFKDETNEIRVFYVDFGDYSWVNLNEIYPLNEKFLRILPFQAIECSLGNYSFFFLLVFNSNLFKMKLCPNKVVFFVIFVKFFIVRFDPAN